MLNKAKEQEALTELGKEIQVIVDDIATRSRGREAELSVQGVNEHRGIAERMYRSFPKLFKGKSAFVESRSSDYPRCILSMAAFNERLKELNPELTIYRTTYDSLQVYLRPSYGRKSIAKEATKVTDKDINAKIAEHIPNIARRLFTEQFIAEQVSCHRGYLEVCPLILKRIKVINASTTTFSLHNRKGSDYCIVVTKSKVCCAWSVAAVYSLNKLISIAHNLTNKVSTITKYSISPAC